MLKDVERLMAYACDISESRAHEMIDLVDTTTKCARGLLAELYEQHSQIEEMQRQIGALREELRREVAAMNRALNQSSPDYGEP
jgi:hypothetical protein